MKNNHNTQTEVEDHRAKDWEQNLSWKRETNREVFLEKETSKMQKM